MKIRTRFAPSPTGYLHIGGLRTALFNYLLAKKDKGNFILRIEDTDRSRLVKSAADNLINILKIINIEPDEGVLSREEKGKYKPYTQSKNIKEYQNKAKELIENNKAYYCFCSAERLDKVRKEQQANKQVPKYDRYCRDLKEEEIKKKLENKKNYVIRFKIPDNEVIECSDLIHGNIKVKSEDLDDFVILKSDQYPTYHLAVVVDDQRMNISHIIRGEEWLPSLPKHILLYQAFNYNLPFFAHLPLLLNKDKSKLSKRQGDVSVEDFIKKGYLPEALINYISLLGWNPGNDREIFSLAELIKEFTLEKVNKSGAIFDLQKLNWFNAEYIKNIVEEKGEKYNNLLNLTKKYIPERTEDILKLFSTRINYLEELKELSSFLFSLPEYDKELLIFKKSNKEKTIKGLELILKELEDINNWEEGDLNTKLKELTENNNLTPGDIFWPLRVACSGLDKSPSPAEILEFLKKEESIKRVKLALDKLK